MSQQEQTTVIPASQRLQAQFSFTRVPNEIIEHPRLSMQAKMIWIELWKFCYHANGRGIFPGMAKLAQDLNTSEDTIRRHRQQLEDEHLLVVKRRGLTKTNLYMLYTPDLVKKNPEPAESSDQELASMRDQKPAPVRDKEDEVGKNKIKKTKKIGSGKPTVPRKLTKYPKDWYKQTLDAYQKIRGIELNGPELSPLRQTLKTIFMAGHKPTDVIGLMRALEGSEEEWTCNWTLRTVKMKLPLWKAGGLSLGDEQARIREYDRQILAGEAL